MRKQWKQGNKATVNHGCTCSIYKSNTNFDSKAEITCQDHYFNTSLWQYIHIVYNFENKPRGLYFSKALLEGLTFGGAYIRRGLSTEVNLHFKLDRASLIVGSKFTIFSLFYFVFEGNFPSTSRWGGLYLEGRFNRGFFALLVWGAYIWRGLFSEFYGISVFYMYKMKLGINFHLKCEI